MNKNLKAGLITVGVVLILAAMTQVMQYFIDHAPSILFTIAGFAHIAAIVLLFITIKSTLK